MKQSNFFKYLSAALLLVNLILISLLIFPDQIRKRPPQRKATGNARNLLELNDQQHMAFLDLATAHGQIMDSLNLQQKELLRIYFLPLNSGSESPDSQVILDELQEIERVKITSTYQHFLDVKEILEPGQESLFKDFVRFTLGRILEDDQKRPPPPPNHP